MFFPSLASSPALPRERPRPGDRHRPGNGETTPRRLPTHAPRSPRNFPSAQRRRGARHAARWETQPGSAVPPGTARRQRRAPGSRRGPAGAPLRTPRAAPRPRAKSASALPSAPRSPGCPHPRAPPAEHPARPARFFFQTNSTIGVHPHSPSSSGPRRSVYHPPHPSKKKKKRKSPDEQPQLCRRCQSPLPTERIERCSLPTPPPPLRDPPARDGPGAARAPSTFPARGRQRNAARAAPRGSAQRRKIRAESRNAKSGGGEEINCKEKKKDKI